MQRGTHRGARFPRRLAVGLAAAVVALGGPLAAAAPTTAKTAATSAAYIHLSPDSGPPGTRVTITGYAPGGSGKGQPFGNACWGGCPGGFMESLYVTWSGSHFRASFLVPSVPYLTNSGPEPVRDGPVAVAINCVGVAVKGCAGSTEAAATFRVTGPTPPTCLPGHRCAYLQLEPDSAAPGDVVRVTGWAPLTQIIGQPFGYQLALSSGVWGGAKTDTSLGNVQQTLNGDVTATIRLPEAAFGIGLVKAGTYILSLTAFVSGPSPAARVERDDMVRVPLAKGGAENLYLAPVRLHVRPYGTWAALGQGAPQLVQASVPLDIASRLGHAEELAYCAAGVIRVSTDGGRTWASVSARGAVAASTKTAFPLVAGQGPGAGQATCSAVVPDPSAAHTFYAAFAAFHKGEGAPPVYTVLYRTGDGGASWQPVPAPRGFNAGEYGGITAVPGGVTVLYGTSAGGPDATATGAMAASTSLNGGATWREAPLACPTAGACVRFAPAPSVFPGMGAATLQPLLRSLSSGRSWQTLTWPQGNVISQGTSGQSQLASYGGRDLLLASSGSPYPVCVSTDGGASWRPVDVPLLPGTADAPVTAGQVTYPELMLLPDGSLLASNAAYPAPDWYRLAPGATRWQLVAGLHAQPDDGQPLVALGRLWWVQQGFSHNVTTYTAESAPLP